MRIWKPCVGWEEEGMLPWSEFPEMTESKAGFVQEEEPFLGLGFLNV